MIKHRLASNLPYRFLIRDCEPVILTTLVFQSYVCISILSLNFFLESNRKNEYPSIVIRNWRTWTCAKQVVYCQFQIIDSHLVQLQQLLNIFLSDYLLTNT